MYPWFESSISGEASPQDAVDANEFQYVAFYKRSLTFMSGKD
jgi:hypothetical protein